jgi:hypothetical protein
MIIAAGILMIMYGLKTLGIYVSSIFLYGWDFRGDYLDLALFLLSIIAAVFFITGGVFCLKRKYWKLCFASSLCLSVFVFFDVLPTFYLLESLNMPYRGLGPLLLPWGILPIILVCVRKSEWQEISA